MSTIHVRPSVIARHQAAPLSKEREKFLADLSLQGFNHVNARGMAGMLLHVVRLLKLEALRPVTIQEIEAASDQWAADTDHHLRRPAGATAKRLFVSAARRFLSSLGLLHVPSLCPCFRQELDQYSAHIRDRQKLSPSTVRGYLWQATNFLAWISGRHSALSSITHHDLEDFIAFKRQTLCANSIFTTSQSIRSFLTFASEKGWCAPELLNILSFPNRRRWKPDTIIPAWRDVRRILDDGIGESPKAIRDRAMLLLCAIYGFRSSEVTGLRVTDIDWAEETISITRAKNGRRQTFTLQYEVGLAIFTYLKHARPKTLCKNLFLIVQRPYSPVTSTVLNAAVSHRLHLLNISSTNRGPHILRHACATQLLRTGSSLHQIADFLGHRGTWTVSTYARYDKDALRQVAAFGLRSVL